NLVKGVRYDLTSFAEEKLNLVQHTGSVDNVHAKRHLFSADQRNAVSTSWLTGRYVRIGRIERKRRICILILVDARYSEQGDEGIYESIQICSFHKASWFYCLVSLNFSGASSANPQSLSRLWRIRTVN